MYLDAMHKAEASTESIKLFIKQIQHGTDVFLVLAKSDLPESVKLFLNFTFTLLEKGKAHEIAAAFTFGREELIPDMFTSIITEIQKRFPENDLDLFKYYFDRHIELDEDEHGPMALQLVEELCGNDSQKWKEAEECAVEALNIRHQLWSGIAKEIELKKAIA
jgi:pyrroloquinoline quinone (PQQ) biosynthesis protein C